MPGPFPVPLMGLDFNTVTFFLADLLDAEELDFGRHLKVSSFS